MSKENQNDELVQMYRDLAEIFNEEYEKRRLITPQNTAEKMTAKGYRKQSDYREELIEAFDNYISEMTISKWGTKDECETARAAVRMAVAFVLGEPPKMKGGAE